MVSSKESFHQTSSMCLNATFISLFSDLLSSQKHYLQNSSLKKINCVHCYTYSPHSDRTSTFFHAMGRTSSLVNQEDDWTEEDYQ